MSRLHLVPSEERKLFFDAAAAASGLNLSILEKDFWVVWTLDRLFSLPELKSHLTFKGGTSLSKVYGVIKRFSEDIDVSIEKDFLGFDKGKDPERAGSKKKQRAAIDALASACSEYIQNKLIGRLGEAIAGELGTQKGWKLILDEKDPDGQTILFEYPKVIERSGYIKQ